MSGRRLTIYVLIIAVLLAGLFTGRAFFFNLAYLLGGLLIIAYIWSFFAVRGVTIGRKTKSLRLQVGGSLEETFTIRNRSLLPKLWLEVRDESNLPGHRASHVVPALGLRGRYTWTTSTPCVTRGEYRLGPLTVLSGDPFGLFSAPRKLAATTRIIVYPAVVRIQQFDLPAGVLSGGDSERRRTHDVTPYVAGIREYTTGDGYNRIHWKQSAKRGRLMVKEFETDPQFDIWLFVDFSAASLVEDSALRRIDGIGALLTHPFSGLVPPSTEEYIAVIAASLARHFLIDRRRPLGFSAYTPEREVFQPGRGEAQLRRILQSLALARSFTPFSLAEMLALETPYFSRRTSVIIVTASLDPAWIVRAQGLGLRGLRPVCVLVDPESFGGFEAVDEARALLRAARIPHTIIRRGDDLSAALSGPLR